MEMSRIIIAYNIKEPVAYFDSWNDVFRWLELYATIKLNEYCYNGNQIQFKTLYI